MTHAGIDVVDLDLDVLTHADGTVDVLDREDHERNRVEMDYPADVCSYAHDALDRVLSDIGDGREPFDGAIRETEPGKPTTAERWLARLSQAVALW